MSTQAEQEQLEELKNFWTEYGKPIFIGILLAIAVVAVWKFWQNHKETNKLREAQSYQALVYAMMQPTDKINEQDVKDAEKQIVANSSSSYYGQYAQFFLAKLAVDKGKLDEAADILKNVLDKSKDTVISELARQRLALVLSAQGKIDEALQLLDAPVEQSFSASRQELKGDLLFKKGDIEQARNIYKEALAIAEKEKSSSKLIIKLKLDDIANEDK